MRSWKLPHALAVLSAVLLGVVIWQARLLHRYRSDDVSVSPTRADPVNPFSSAAPVASARTAPFRDMGSARPAAAIEPVHPPFDWQDVESEDYQTYIDNLRSIGCPPQTVEDIVVADVMGTFAATRADVMAKHLQGFEYWRSDAETLALRGELEREQREVDDWMDTVLREYLGPEIESPSTASAWEEAALAEHLSVLPPRKQEAALALLVQYAGVDAKFRQISEHRRAMGDPDEALRVIEAYDRKIDSLNALLTPEEYELVDMTISWTADNLRKAMKEFEPTEEEYQAIFREWRAQDESLAMMNALGEPDPGRAHVFRNISTVLSPERYARYRMTWWK